MSYFVYILYSERDKNLYTGCTNNLNDRIKKHHAGYVIATKHRRPLQLIYSEVYKNKADAFNRERFLKSLWSGRFKKKILKNYLKKITKTVFSIS
ncbi:MAG: GIY-YIG nuclease family protein [Parcubacteria group bacterium]|nr:GIY-YIG nuclease family protein [Parcubacteria group bacterium]